jgi:hypothetical protein
MKVRFLSAVVLTLVFAAAAGAQDANQAPPNPQDGDAGGAGSGNGRGGNGRGGMGMGMAGGRGLMGTVTEVAADHFMVKTVAGGVYTVHFSANTRFLKQQPGQRSPGGRGAQGRGDGQGGGGGMGMGRGGNPPLEIKATDIKAGDAVGAMGELDATAKSMGAVAIFQLDPERARQMAEMQANYGKTWIQGKVTAIDGVKVTVMGSIDNAAHDFVADENTTLRKRREPITLADIQVGDMVRADGTLKGGTFTATTVNVMDMVQGGSPSVPRSAPPPQ